MLIMNSSNVNTDIADVNSAGGGLPLINTKINTSYNELISDVVDISSLGIERSDKDRESQATKDIEQIDNEAVSINSTIGRSKSTNNLNHIQAKELYNKIASLL